MNMLKWLRTREPQPGRDCSVTLPTTATTNQFIDPDEREKLQKLFDDVCDQRRDALAEVDRLRERVKELEAEVRRDRETNSGYAKDLAVLLDASLASESDAERLRKAIEEALHAQQHRGLKVAREILKSALSPSPAAASGEKPMVFENCTIEKFPASAPAAESEPTACSDRGVFAESGAAKVVCDLEREICELTRRLATCEERLGRTEQERDAAIVKCNAASQKIAAWRGLIREQRAKITALEKKQGIEERTPGPVFDVTHAENRVLPPEFQLSKIAKDWVVDPRVQASGHAGHRPGTIPGRQGFLKLGVRARKTLIRLNIQTVGQLMQYTSQELLAIKNTGISTLREIQEALAACDLYLLDDPRRK